ncbi:MAG: efflux RND transporter periplasmic adaptor subunit [Gammaproteobacteria bacterium]
MRFRQSDHQTRRLRRIINRCLVPVLFVILLTSCSQPAPVAEQIRAIKTMTVADFANGRTRKFAGVVMSTDFSMLAFEVGGNVASVDVDIGDKVAKGQKLAALNPADFELQLKAAQADLVKVRADLLHKEIEYKRELSIFQQGAGSQRQVDRTRYDYKAAQATVDYARSKVKIAERDLRKTVLTAPYEGNIAKRMIQPFMEVAAGQEVLRIDAAGSLEIWLGVSESVVNFLEVGSAASVTFPTLVDQSVDGKISYLGSAAGEANLFPVKVVLTSKPKEVFPGMTAEVALRLNAEGQTKGFRIPPAAILPIVDEPGQGFVFVYDPETSTVEKKLIHLTSDRSNLGIVNQGLSEGDILATAGVSFLADGMKVKLLNSSN